MVFLAMLVTTGLGVAVGFGLGRFKTWVTKHEKNPQAVEVDSTVLRTRLRMKGIVKNAKV